MFPSKTNWAPPRRSLPTSLHCPEDGRPEDGRCGVRSACSCLSPSSCFFLWILFRAASRIPSALVLWSSSDYSGQNLLSFFTSTGWLRTRFPAHRRWSSPIEMDRVIRQTILKQPWFVNGIPIVFMLRIPRPVMIDCPCIIEGSLEVKLPTIWTDEKQRWEEAERGGRLEERRVEEKE